MLLKEREIGKPVSKSAVKMEYYLADHPQLIINQIKSIPLVKKKTFDLQTEILKNLEVAHKYD